MMQAKFTEIKPLYNAFFPPENRNYCGCIGVKLSILTNILMHRQEPIYGILLSLKDQRKYGLIIIILTINIC